MKAENTRHFISCLIDRTRGEDSHIKSVTIFNTHWGAANKELDQLERLVAEYQSPETQRLIKVGRATEEAFSDVHVCRLYVWDENSLFAKKNVIESPEALLDWAKLDDIAGRREG